ncbi:phosphoribosylanthranilate isomerase [Hydrogenimonas cancrithermarum]|uniref:N-(5'-phosphoribosyl)anthranilate isomerase n=1 Tax=Hydrogenimonas cancrithermarum TaxID=2993563 RepID=A0ABM8FK55_9BACT|nr:phosphoribosylanthranilate isomerase [Hydrogenimonas cancrithermarum]BDY12679.1 N-(5'-phosphoribosyl)anthranilate isomerase [Hydrogenimonas cancrithermarum]
MPRVKICGITSYEDAMAAIEAGADALGFVFYEKSPRFITPAMARAIVDQLPPFVERVGLFVDRTPLEVDIACAEAGMGLAQIHFEVDESYLHALKTKTLPVVRAREPEEVMNFAGHYRLVDAYCESYGGAGKRLNLEWFEGVDCSRIVLAGGLTPENVAEAVRRYGFYGVDVSSGVELEKGKKDPEKVRAFVQAAKEAGCAH